MPTDPLPLPEPLNTDLQVYLTALATRQVDRATASASAQAAETANAQAAADAATVAADDTKVANALAVVQQDLQQLQSGNALAVSKLLTTHPPGAPVKK
jgi:hypothetical protein